jgi:mannose-6-phosphate isomerase-like protein (cupin superfamily)
VPFEVAGEVGLVVEADGGGRVSGRGALEQEAAGGVDAASGYVGVGAQAELAGEAAHQVRDGAVQGGGGPGQALAAFDDVYSPRIVGRVNDYDVKVAHTAGEHVWHVHEHTDEFFLVIDGRFAITLREPGGQERAVELSAGDIFVVPKGTEHKPSSPGGAILMFEPSGTLTTGDRHEGDIPAYVDTTTGRDIGQ